MPDASVWAVLLVAAAAAHVGLELVVQLVVYPALALGSSASPATARRAHESHMARMSVAVAPVYLSLVVTTLGTLVVAPSVLSVAAMVLLLAVLAVTAVVAVPLHERIVRTTGSDERARLHARLGRADLARLLLGVALLAVALALALA